MTPDEIAKKLPNGFREAFLEKMEIDYFENWEARFEIDVCIGTPDAEDPKDREAYRKGRLTILDVQLFAVEPPRPEYDFRRHDFTLMAISGLRSDPPDECLSPSPREKLPEGAFLSWFSFAELGARIIFSGMDAKFEWH